LFINELDEKVFTTSGGVGEGGDLGRWLRRQLADYAAGRVVPHDRVREWLAKLARAERVPPTDV
jgi:hypothetical protein